MRTTRPSRNEAKQIAPRRDVGATSRFVAIYAAAALVALLSLLIMPSVFGATTISTNISTGGNLTVTGNTTVSGNMTVSGNTTLGDAATDTITVTGKLAGGSLFFVKEVNAELSIQDTETAGAAGPILHIGGANGSTTGAGGEVDVQGGTGGTTSGTGGALNLHGGTGGTGGGNGGDTTVAGGNGTASTTNGGSVFIRGGSSGSAGTNGNVLIGTTNTNTITIGYASGTTTITGFTQHSAGTVSLPSISFSGDTDTGLFASAANTLQLVAGGYNPIQLGTSSSTLSNVTINGTTTAGNILAGDGVVGNPVYSFSGDPDTGIFRNTTNSMQFVAGGKSQLTIGSSTSDLIGVTITGSTSIVGNLKSGVAITNGSTTLDVAGSTTNTGLCKQGTPSAVDDVVLVDCDAAPAADYAERYPVAKDVDYGDIVVPGTRVVYTDSVQLPNADGSGFNTFPSHAIVELVKSNIPYQEPIAGIVSENWGDFTSAGNNINKKDNPKPVALVGRVPIKVTNEGGPIAIGDFLTTSSTPGHAMKATKAGRVIGMALGNFSGTKGKVMVQVLNTWWNPMVGENQTSAATTQLQPSTNVALEKVEKLTVQKNATIQGRLIVKGNARFNGQIIVGKDTAGIVNVKAGQKTARVDFATIYKKMPIVTVTPLGNPGGYYWVSDVSEKGFTINISKTPSSDLGFNWIALGSNAGLGEEEAKVKIETASSGLAQ